VASNLPKTLKRSSEFTSLKQSGSRVSPNKWLLLNYQANPGSLVFGITASRKVGPAVVRNKLKRWCREYFRALAKSGISLEFKINVIFKPIDQGLFKGLEYDVFKQAMDRALQLMQKHPIK